MSRLTKKINDGLVLDKYTDYEKALMLHKLCQHEDVEEELGCPLEVVFKALKEGIYQSDGGRRKYPTIEYNEATKKFYFTFGTYCNVDDYKKTWWLREDKSE